MMRHRTGGGGGGGGGLGDGGPNDLYGGGAYNAYGGGYGGYKDKPHLRKRGSFVLPGFMTKPWTGIVLSALLGALAWHYRRQSAGLLQAMQVSSVKQGRDLVERLQSERKEAERGLQKAKITEKQALVRIQALEKQQSALEKERDKYKNLAAASSANDATTGAGAGAAAGGIAAAVVSAVSPEAAKKREADLVTFLQRLQNSTQQASKDAVMAKYGPGPHRVQFTVDLPGHDQAAPPPRFVVEMAPVDDTPHAVHVFLEQVSAGLWNAAWFYVNGPHVLQCGPRAADADVDDDKLDDRELALKPFAERRLSGLYYPEYSARYPHERWTLGMTGRPGGPDWYINKQNNTIGHGPGGQGQFPLADLYGDPCFAKVVDGFDTLERVFSQPTIQAGNYRFFFDEPVHITKAEIVSPIAPQPKPWLIQQQSQAQREQETSPQDGAPQSASQQQQQQQQLLQQQAQSQQQEQPPQAQTQHQQALDHEQQQIQQSEQQQPQQQGGQSVEFVNDPAVAAAASAEGATPGAHASESRGEGKRMRQLMMAKLPPLNVEP